MKTGSTLRRQRGSLVNSAGTIVFGMEDGTVSIFGLIFGVAATTTSAKTVLIAGASGAAAAAVSMMAGAYLDVETTRDQADATLFAAGSSSAALSNRLAGAGLTAEQSRALARAVQNDRNAVDGLLLALTGGAKAPLDPLEQALWMLFADFFAAARAADRLLRSNEAAAGGAGRTVRMPHAFATGRSSILPGMSWR